MNLDRLKRNIRLLRRTIRHFGRLDRELRVLVILRALAALAGASVFVVAADWLFFGGAFWHIVAMTYIYMAYYLPPLYIIMRHPAPNPQKGR